MFDYEVLMIIYKSGQYELIHYDNLELVLDILILHFDLIERIIEI
jgi:hypothetical protein